MEGVRKIKSGLVRALAIAVVILSSIIVVEWLSGMPLQQSLFPYSITTKFTTAVSFVVAGLMLYLIPEKAHHLLRSMLLPLLTLALVILIFPVFVSSLLGLETGFEQLFVKESAGTTMTVFPGKPAVATMVDFLLIMLSGALAILEPSMKKPALLAGLINCLSGASAIMGYLLGIPSLYFDIPGLSNPMAIPTALMFVLLGAALVSIAQDGEDA
ncbi:MAG: hypothetical protein AB1529_03515 [Candidatus Micrarchaeota archaeon]